MKNYSISYHIARAKAFDPILKDRIRAMCDELDRLTRENSPITSVKSFGAFCYVTENCFDKRKGDVTTDQIRAIIS